MYIFVVDFIMQVNPHKALAFITIYNLLLSEISVPAFFPTNYTPTIKLIKFTIIRI